MVNVNQIIDHYYGVGDSHLKQILVTHSRMVMKRALRIASHHLEWDIDTVFLREASMLHDIGIVRCDAAGIECFGSEPYIRHGLVGGEMLRAEGLPRHARVCERHTGAGLSLSDIVRQDLPLPHQDFLPETLEEQIICYADKFYSKTRPSEEKSLERAIHSLAKFGDEGLQRFLSWAQRFEGK